jgi:hypothetical protein
MGILKRVLGLEKVEYEDTREYSQTLREAATAKSHVAQVLNSTTSKTEDKEHLSAIARKKQREAEMLRQLAAEMELAQDKGE